jgi:hypothetical protein
MPALFALNVDRGTIGNFLVGPPVQRSPERECVRSFPDDPRTLPRKAGLVLTRSPIERRRRRAAGLYAGLP